MRSVKTDHSPSLQKTYFNSFLLKLLKNGT